MADNSHKGQLVITNRMVDLCNRCPSSFPRCVRVKSCLMGSHVLSDHKMKRILDSDVLYQHRDKCLLKRYVFVWLRKDRKRRKSPKNSLESALALVFENSLQYGVQRKLSSPSPSQDSFLNVFVNISLLFYGTELIFPVFLLVNLIIISCLNLRLGDEQQTWLPQFRKWSGKRSWFQKSGKFTPSWGKFKSLKEVRGR